MRHFWRILFALSLIAGAAGYGSSQSAAPNAAGDEIARIIGYSFTRGGGVDFLETLTDTIGGRITGSPGSRQAAELIVRTLKDAGFASAHIEEYDLPVSWQHGPAIGEILSPVHRPILIGTYGWAPGTGGPAEVPLVDIGAIGDGSGPVPPEVKGAAVIVDLVSNALSTSYVGARSVIARRLAQAGAEAMFIVSDKPDRMLYTSAFGFYPRAPLPVLSIPAEDAGLLRRLLARGAVRLRLDVQNAFPGAVKERNVVAEITGSDPREMVLVTAHFDDWDPAQGANDNGAGVAVVLEVARIFKELRIQPKSTIRFVFFSGEEELSNGSRAYAEQHRAELDRIRAVFNLDVGSDTPIGFKIHGRQDTEGTSKKLLSALAPLGADRVFLDADFDSDQETFIVEGVPIYSLRSQNEGYGSWHHTITDTFEHVDPQLLKLQTAVMGVAAYSFANAPERPGPRLSRDQVQELLKRTGLYPLYKMEYGIPDEK